MKKIYLIAFFLGFIGHLDAQKIDTTLVVITPSSTIRIVYSGYNQEGIYQKYSVGLQILMNFGSDVVNEAVKRSITKDEIIGELLYDSECRLIGISTSKKAELSQLNLSFEAYKLEFIHAFNEHHLHRYFKEMDDSLSCGLKQLTLIYKEY